MAKRKQKPKTTSKPIAKSTAKSKSTSRKKRLTKAEQIASMPIEDIIEAASGGNRDVLEKYASTLKGGYTRRVNTFKKAGMFSYAQETYERGGPPPSRKTPFKSMSYNQLIHEIARYQQFFNSQTASVQGIREVNQEQDARLFGVDENGNPKDTLSDDERILMWSLYMEFNNQFKTKFGSNQTQRMLASMVKAGVDGLDMHTIITRARNRLYYRSRRENERNAMSNAESQIQDWKRPRK